MRFNFIAVLAMVALVAGCESASKSGGAVSGGGGGVSGGADGGRYAVGSQEQLVAEVGDRVFSAMINTTWI